MQSSNYNKSNSVRIFNYVEVTEQGGDNEEGWDDK